MGLQGTGVGVEAGPGLQVVEEGLSGALGGRALSVADEPVVGADAALGHAAIDQLLEGVAGGDWREGAGEGADHAHAHRLVVVAGRVGTLAIPAPALVGATVPTDTPVVADISPAVGVHVEVLDVAHLSGARSLGGARSAGGVVDHDEGRRAVGQQGGGGGTRSPSGTINNRGTRWRNKLAVKSPS